MDICRYSCRLAYPDNDEYEMYLNDTKALVDQIALKTWHFHFKTYEDDENVDYDDLIKYLIGFQKTEGVDIFSTRGVRRFFMPKLLNAVQGLGERKDVQAEKAYERMFKEQFDIGPSNDPFLMVGYEALVEDEKN